MGDQRTPLFRSTIRVGPARKAEPALAPKNRYEAAEDLGQGGMGKVARGVDRFLGRPVAFKRSIDGDPQMLEALLHEAEIAARLDHPSIVTIHDVAYDERDEPFVVMRLVDGQPLSAVLAGADFAARLRLLPRVVSAIEAVAYAHTQGVVHRDLKPDNILVATRGDTVVIDWGLALDTRGERDPFEGASVGTPGFMAPEQSRGERADPRVDVYALGVTLYYVLSGRLAAEDEQLPSLASVPGVPADLVTIVDKACSWDRAARYPTATELAADLDRFIGGQLVASHRYGLGQRIVRWIRQHRIAVAIATVAIVASVTFGAISLRRVLAARALAEREREIAADRADQLLVDRARAAVADDPARAIALLDLRAKPVLDLSARMVSIDAIARGIPYSRKSHDGMVTQVLSVGGDRFVTGGFDGKLVFHDGSRGATLLASHAAPITMIHPVTGGFIVQVHEVVEHYDLQGTKRGAWTTPTTYSAAHGDWIVHYDAKGRGLIRTLDDSVRYPLPEAVNEVEIDRRGKWIILATKHGAHVVDTATGARRVLTKANTRQISASPNGDRVMVISQDNEIEEWTTADWKLVERFQSEAVMYAYLGEQRASLDGNGCVRLEARDGTRLQLRCYENFAGAYQAKDGWIMIGQDRELELFDRGERTRLSGAVDSVLRIVVDPTRRYVFAGTRAGYATLWDLESRSLVVDRVHAAAAMLDGVDLIADVESKLVRIGRDHSRTPIGDINLPGMGRKLIKVGATYFTFHPGGPVFAMRDGKLTSVFDGLAYDVAKRNDNELLIRTTDDRLLWLHDADARTGKLIPHESKVSAIGANELHGAMAVGFSDGRVTWEGRDNVRKTARLACAPSRLLPGAEGVDVACDDVLYAVSGDGVIREVAKFRELVLEWRRKGDRLLVLTMSGAVWRVDGGVMTKLLPESESQFVALADDRFAMVDRPSGTVWLYDLEADVRARIGTIRLPSGMSLSPDGRTLVVTGRTLLLRWFDPTPVGDVDWKTWRTGLTRATLSQPNAALQWP